MRPALRPYQVDLIARVDAEVDAGRRRVLIVAPTGAGKMVMAARDHRPAGPRRPPRALPGADRRELIQQSSQKLYIFGVDHRDLAPGLPNAPRGACPGRVDRDAARPRGAVKPDRDAAGGSGRSG